MVDKYFEFSMHVTTAKMAPLCAMLLLPLVLGDLNSCLEELTKVLEGLKTLAPTTHYEEMASYSGKSINDLGDYFSCCNLKDAEYALFTAAESYATLALGFCGPQNCTAADYIQIIEDFEGKGGAVGTFAENVKALKKHKHVLRAQATTELPLAIVFPQTFIHRHFDNLSAGAIIMLILCCFIVLLAIIGSVLDYLNQNAKNDSSSSIEMVGVNEYRSLEPPARSKLMDFLVCFSLYTSFPKLFASRSSEKVGQQSDTLDILNGVRVMSMGWVILGHVYVFRLNTGVTKNLDDLTDIFKQAKTAIIYGGFWAVDSFFWLSGLLMAFLLLQQLKAKGNFSAGGWAYLYGHRFYRILPAYMFVLFLTWAFLKYSGNGPLWFMGDTFNNQCHDYWWTNLLFLNNFIPHGDGSGCLGQSWYLANDMQFFLLSPPLLFIYHKFSKIAGWLLIVVVCIVNVVASMVITSEKNYNVVLFAREDTSFMSDYYTKPYCRSAAYVIGIATGIILFEFRENKRTGEVKDRFSMLLARSIGVRWIRYGWYVLGLAIINFFMFIQYNAYKDVDNQWETWTKGENMMFIGFNRLFWGLGLTLVLLPVLLGHNTIIRWFLAHSVWTPLARLTFCTYLVHLSLLMPVYLSMNTAYWLNDLNIGIDLVFITIISYAAAVPVSLLIESPFMAFEKLLKGSKPAPKAK